MALGASEGLVQRELLTKALRVAVSGVALGTLASFALTNWIESLLFGTTPTDPAVFSGVFCFCVSQHWLLVSFRRDAPRALIRWLH
jgi:ABC-type lipoprotein release transport system permease subunit